MLFRRHPFSKGMRLILAGRVREAAEWCEGRLRQFNVVEGEVLFVVRNSWCDTLLCDVTAKKKWWGRCANKNTSEVCVADSSVSLCEYPHTEVGPSGAFIQKKKTTTKKAMDLTKNAPSPRLHFFHFFAHEIAFLDISLTSTFAFFFHFLTVNPSTPDCQFIECTLVWLTPQNSAENSRK